MNNFLFKSIGLFSFIFFSSLLIIPAINAQVKVVPGDRVGMGTNTPDASAKLDINSGTQGLLIPRISFSDVADPASFENLSNSKIPNPALGLQVYLMHADEDKRGIFVFDGEDISVGKWIKLGGGESGLQTLSSNEDPGSISISGGESIVINVKDADHVIGNELQTLTQSGNDITLSHEGGTVTIVDNVNDADFDPDNEHQTLSQSGNDITLSKNGGTVSIANELPTGGSNGDILETNGNGVYNWIPANTINYWTENGSDLHRLSNVGIGTNTPLSPLHLGNNVGTNFSNFNNYQILLYKGATPQFSYGLGIRGGTLAFNAHTRYQFDHANNTTLTLSSTLLDMDGGIRMIETNEASPTKIVVTSGDGVLKTSDLSSIAGDANLWEENGEEIFRESNVGIGTTNPTTNLDVIGVTKTSEYFNGVQGTSQGTSINKVSNIELPGGATFSAGNNVTGAIKIALPVSWTNTMIKMKVEVFNYNASVNRNATYFITGYNYAVNSRWYNTSATVLTSDAINNRTVRFGHDGTNVCVYIGETTDKWQYPKVTVKEVMVGFQNATVENFNDGWNVELVNSFGTITSNQTKTDILPVSQNEIPDGGANGDVLQTNGSGDFSWISQDNLNLWTENTSNEVYRSSNVGIGTTNPTYPLDVIGRMNSTSHVSSGSGSGGVALTINDGKGNANVTFNHANGRPEQNGNAARIEVNTDASVNAFMDFELSSGVNAGVFTSLSNIMRLRADGNVGIGTLSPTAKLHVNGNIRMTETAITNPNKLVATDGQGLLRTVNASDYIQTWTTLPGIPGDIANGDDVNDADSDPSNEFQDLSLSGNILQISDGQNADLSKYENLWTKNGSNEVYRQSYVGIGIDNPEEPLHVVGRILAEFPNSNNTNMAIGNLAGNALNVNAKFNIALGQFAGRNSSDTDANTYIGFQAGRDDTATYGDNIFIGTNSGRENSGNHVVAIGSFAGFENDGHKGTFVGFNAGAKNKGIDNVFLGASSGYNSQDINNVFVGASAGHQHFSGSDNVLIGRNSGTNATSANNVVVEKSVALGSSAKANASNSVTIGHNSKVDASNSVAIGFNAAVLESNVVYLKTGSSNGRVETDGNIFQTSDARFKSSIQDDVPGLDFISKLKPVSYDFENLKFEKHRIQTLPDSVQVEHLSNFTDTEVSTKRLIGFLAQDIETICDDLNFDFRGLSRPDPNNPASHYSVSYSQFVMPLVKAVQEQQEIIDEQEQLLQSLIKRIDALERE